MDKKKSFKNKSSSKQKETFQDKLAVLEEKYQKLKEILKQVLKDLKHEKVEKEALQKQCSKLEEEIKEKESLLERMHSVSEAVVDEFSALKAKCDIEAEAACNARKRATKYFHENQILKGNVHYDSSLLIKSDSDGLCNNTYDEHLSEMEILNKMNSDLRTEIASMKTKLLKEEEKQDSLKEEFDIVKQLYEDEMRQHKGTAEKLKSLETLYESVVQAVNSQINIEDSNFVSTSSREECNINTENNSKAENSLKRDITATLNLIEKQRNNLQSRVKELELQISNMKFKGSCVEHKYVPPPPPPPLPPQPAPFNPFKSLKAMINSRKKWSQKNIITAEGDYACDHQKAISEMVDAIKKGSVKLKPIPKNDPKPEVNENEPAAVTEMKNILLTLKQRKKEEPDNCFSDVNPFSKVTSSVGENSSIQSYVNQDSELQNSLSVEDLYEKIADCSSLENISLSSASYNISEKELKYSDLLCYDSLSIEEDNKDDNVMII